MDLPSSKLNLPVTDVGGTSELNHNKTGLTVGVGLAIEEREGSNQDAYAQLISLSM